MQASDSSNSVFQMAVQFVNQTNKHIFLTGKAGTGKTTFLKFIKENSFKKMAVVAPTGVAAINAGGVTMHSFFQLPFGPFIPSNNREWNSANVDQHTLFKNIRFNKEKRELLQELDLLVIDEVSMVRADMLDAVDTILRHFRQQPFTPFGGLQVLYIGDLFQLPPVVNKEEWEGLLSRYYKSPFFFDAQVMQQAPPMLIELKKIYRQNEKNFIYLLNNIRNNNISYEDLEILHLHYKPGFEPPEEDYYITLTTHNSKAQDINQQKLQKLPGKAYSFHAEISGDFHEKAYPADKDLQLKLGAQIMFIKNDKGEARRYYNGKIASIAKIEDDKICVSFPGETDYLGVEKETWKNIRYNFNKDKDQIDEEELGTFKQYPIRLAWAITIHKSQGLTFEKAIIDAGASFAPGQVYVALSRLTSLEGLILYSRIQPQAISTDSRVLDFIKSEMAEDQLELELQQQKRVFISRSLMQSFNWEKLMDAFQQHLEEYEHRLIPEKETALEWANTVQEKLSKQQEWANKFIKQLELLLVNAEEDGYKQLQSRVAAAVNYFKTSIGEISSSLQAHIKEVKIKQRIKKYLSDLYDLDASFKRKNKQLQHAEELANALMKGMDADALLELIEEQKKAKTIAGSLVEETAIPKPKRGETRFISLQLFREGKKPEEIAKLRGLATGTIESHIISFISTEEVHIGEIIPKEKIEKILAVIKENPEATTSSAIKEKLGSDFSFNDIKAVMIWKELPVRG